MVDIFDFISYALLALARSVAAGSFLSRSSRPDSGVGLDIPEPDQLLTSGIRECRRSPHGFASVLPGVLSGKGAAPPVVHESAFLVLARRNAE